jgi:hypothetical protein
MQTQGQNITSNQLVRQMGSTYPCLRYLTLSTLLVRTSTPVADVSTRPERIREDRNSSWATALASEGRDAWESGRVVPPPYNG